MHWQTRALFSLHNEQAMKKARTPATQLQDEAWQRRNRLAVTSAEVPHEVPVATGAEAGAAAQRELGHLSDSHQPTQHAETVLGAWLFIEKLHISDINSNVTVTLSSNIAALLNYAADEAADAAEGELAEPLQGNQVLHAMKSSGFQLINVNNVAMQLKARRPCRLSCRDVRKKLLLCSARILDELAAAPLPGRLRSVASWAASPEYCSEHLSGQAVAACTPQQQHACVQGKSLEGKLLSANSAIGVLFRHYWQQCLLEAHKVLGGTGPAVAQIPLTVVWAGGTVFDLTRDLASRRVGALSIGPRVGFIALTSMAQLLGVVAKMEAALLAYLPYERGGHLSDGRAVARYIVRPQNAVEAFSMAGRALVEARALRICLLLFSSAKARAEHDCMRLLAICMLPLPLMKEAHTVRAVRHLGTHGTAAALPRCCETCQTSDVYCALQGVLAAGAGLAQDPLAGWRRSALLGVLFGLLKAALGLGLRPIAGMTEFASKATQGVALVCLGRQGIQGKIMRRVYAPGTARRLHERAPDVRCPLLFLVSHL
jgi:hypothetical protein